MPSKVFVQGMENVRSDPRWYLIPDRPRTRFVPPTSTVRSFRPMNAGIAQNAERGAVAVPAPYGSATVTRSGCPRTGRTENALPEGRYTVPA